MGSSHKDYASQVKKFKILKKVFTSWASSFQTFLLFHGQVQPVLGQLRGQRHGHLLGLRRGRREDSHHHSQALIKAGTVPSSSGVAMKSLFVRLVDRFDSLQGKGRKVTRNNEQIHVYYSAGFLYDG